MSRGRVAAALIAAVLGFALTISLGNWQSRRAEYKIALQSQWDAAQNAESVVIAAATLADIPARVPIRVRMTGRFLHQFSVWLDNRQSSGRPGFFVVTPLELDAGAVVLVNRGWVARDAQDRLKLPAIGAPAGTLTLEGLALAKLPRLLELGAADRAGKWPVVWQNLDFAAFEQASGLKVERFVVQQTSPAEDRLVRNWPAPELGSEKHRGYALQWYSLAGLIALLTLYLGPRAWRGADRTGNRNP